MNSKAPGESSLEKRKKLIMERIRFALNDDRASDSQAVEALLRGRYVINGEQAWRALKRFKEQQMKQAEEAYRNIADKLAGDIDGINRRIEDRRDLDNESD